MNGGPRSRVPPPRGVVFDTDGVLLDSAAVHARAWKTAFDACLPAWGGDGGTQAPFDLDAEYRRLVDGRSRFDGAEAFLAARGLRLPPGEPHDQPGCETVWAVAARKDKVFHDLVEASGVPGYADTAPALEALRTAGVPCAAVSASRHARALLTGHGLDRFFAVVVDGTDAAGLHLPGKPDPALFLYATGLLGTEPDETAVVEDAEAGVRAARRGGFGRVVGVDRTPDGHAAAPLREQGADLVVPDLLTLIRTVWGEHAWR